MARLLGQGLAEALLCAATGAAAEAVRAVLVPHLNGGGKESGGGCAQLRGLRMSVDA